MSQLDSLRRQLQDYNFKVLAQIVYNQAYFQMLHEDKMKMRKESNENMRVEAGNELDVTASDNESMYSFQLAHFIQLKPLNSHNIVFISIYIT